MNEFRYTCFVGIDIAADTFSVVWRSSDGKVQPAICLDQAPEGFHALLQSLPSLAAETLILMETTSTYWIPLAAFLHEAGYALSVFNPLQAFGFARTLLKRNKTDSIDAEMLAQMAETLRFPLWSPPPQIYEELRQRLDQRAQLVQIRSQEKNRLHALKRRKPTVAMVLARSIAFIDYLTEQIAAIDKEIKQVLFSDDEWAKSARYLCSIPGIGKILAAWILVSTLNFSMCSSAKQVVSYAGLAPRQYQSGKSIRRRPYIGHAGNPELRRMLYLGAMSAIRYNPPLKIFYERLVANGKAKKAALCAVARKLLCMVYGVAKNQSYFNPNYERFSTIA